MYTASDWIFRGQSTDDLDRAMSISITYRLTSNTQCPVCRVAFTPVYCWYMAPPDAPAVSIVACCACMHLLGMQLEQAARTMNYAP